MMPTRLHGIIDCLYGPLLLAAPFMLTFADDGAARPFIPAPSMTRLHAWNTFIPTIQFATR